MSSAVFNMIRRGAGSGTGTIDLAYTIITGAIDSKPIYNIQENTVLVETSVSIAGYSVSDIAPSSPIPGDIWIETSSIGGLVRMDFVTGSHKISAGVIGVYQYLPTVVEGEYTWTPINASVYTEGRWQDLVQKLYWLGTEYNVLKYHAGAWNGNNANTPDINKNQDHVWLKKINGNISFGYGITDKLNLNDVNYVCFDVLVTSADSKCDMAIWLSKPTTIATNGNLKFNSTYINERHVYKLDVSSFTGAYYVGIRGSTSNSSTFDVKIYRMWYELATKAPSGREPF